MRVIQREFWGDAREIAQNTVKQMIAHRKREQATGSNWKRKGPRIDKNWGVALPSQGMRSTRALRCEWMTLTPPADASMPQGRRVMKLV